MTVRHDSALFTEVYRAHWPHIVTFVRRYGSPDPENTSAETFERAWRARGQLDVLDGGTAGTGRWLNTIARRVLIDEWRRRKARPISEPLDRDSDQFYDNGFVDRLLDYLIAPAYLACLTPAQREVVELRFYADLPFAEIAQVTGKSEDRVRKLSLRGLAKMRRAARAA